jgi:ribosomal protein S18 acetylase RimI-like enzyme
MRVRAARPDDYPTFARLYPELRVDDPVLDDARFAAELAPITFIAEDEAGAPLGYAFYQVIQDVMYIRHLVTAPEARRRGVGRTLMRSVAEKARASRATTWCLNVKPDNAPAIALYEEMGMRRAHESRGMHIAWSAVDAQPPYAGPARARTIEPSDDARVQTEMRLIAGQLAMARAKGRVLVMLEDGDGIAGAAIFDPAFPGAFPFRASKPEHALPLLRALRSHARPGDAMIKMVVEDQPQTVEAILRLGGAVHLDIVHMRGPVPV